jgi:hypothetical protein
MGSRGPLPNSAGRRQVRRATTKKVRSAAVVPAEPSKLPAAPDGLGEPGRAVWDELGALDWTATSDTGSALRLAQLEDERAVLAETLKATGPLLAEPIVTPRGDIVGERQVANPLMRELRRLDAEILKLRDRFGLLPLSRARLGIAVMELARDDKAVERVMARYRAAASEAEDKGARR